MYLGTKPVFLICSSTIKGFAKCEDAIDITPRKVLSLKW